MATRVQADLPVLHYVVLCQLSSRTSEFESYIPLHCSGVPTRTPVRSSFAPCLPARQQLSGQQDLPAPSSLPVAGAVDAGHRYRDGGVTSGRGTGGTVLGAKYEVPEKKR
jgi:hypothetical protein